MTKPHVGAEMPMQHLFSPNGKAALSRALAQRPLLAFDFDGTLTPIVARPSEAHLSGGVSRRLSVLAANLPVAIVTGRSVHDVRGRLGFEPRYIVGNHGAEDADTDMAAIVAPDALSELRERLRQRQQELMATGVTVEDKVHSLALHYRLSRTRDRALGLIHDLLQGRDQSLRVFGGKLVVNVVPSHAPDKADAVRSLMTRSGAPIAVFVGDDVNDEPVFAMAPESWLTVRVGRDNPQSTARYVLDSPAEVGSLLDRMVRLLTQG